MSRPGRKPSNLRRLDVKLEFDSDEEGQLIRARGGGPYVAKLIKTALAQADPDIVTAELHPHDGVLELRFFVPEGWSGFTDALVIRARSRRNLSPVTRARILARDGTTCRNCGALEELEIDHVIPVAAGGSDEDENLQVLCGPCNRAKGAKCDPLTNRRKDECDG